MPIVEQMEIYIFSYRNQTLRALLLAIICLFEFLGVVMSGGH